MTPIMARDLEMVLRCPAQYSWRQSLGPSSDRAFPYGLFALLLVKGVRDLRKSWSTDQWPVTWPIARGRLTSMWDDQWKIETTTEPVYHHSAFSAYERVYGELADHGIPETTRFDERVVILLNGHEVVVHISAIEEIDGEAALVWERAVKSSKDTSAATIALYAAVAQSLMPNRSLPVYIRYLVTGEILPVPKATEVMEKQFERLCQAITLLAGNFFPAYPDKVEHCTYCPFFVICPGPV
jgi:hypothetical protein